MEYNKYPKPMIILHNLVAVLVIATFLLADRDTMFYHKSLGALVLIFALIRLVVRLVYIGKTPPSINPPKSLEYKLEKSVHGLLYLLILFTPILGALTSNAHGYPVSIFGIIDMPMLISKSESAASILGGTHVFLANTFLVLLIVHIAAAFYHLIKEKQNIFTRMWK